MAASTDMPAWATSSSTHWTNNTETCAAVIQNPPTFLMQNLFVQGKVRVSANEVRAKWCITEGIRLGRKVPGIVPGATQKKKVDQGCGMHGHARPLSSDFPAVMRVRARVMQCCAAQASKCLKMRTQSWRSRLKSSVTGIGSAATPLVAVMRVVGPGPRTVHRRLRTGIADWHKAMHS